MVFSHNIRNLVKFHVLDYPIVLDDRFVLNPLIVHLIVREWFLS